MQKLVARQKNTFWLVLGVAAGIIILIILIIFLSGKDRNSSHNASKRLEDQNKSLVIQNKGLIETVDKWSETIEVKLKQDSIQQAETQENIKLLPNMNNNISSIKKSYEKSTHRTLDAVGVEQYISNEARRIRDEQNKRPEFDY